jgi:predicted NBD/HSP70 family sugar kinase
MQEVELGEADGMSREVSPLRQLNRQRVLAAVRELDAASRADLERVTGLSRGTVASIVADLRREGALRLTYGPGARAGVQGRPPMLLTLAAPPGLAVAVDIGHGHVRVAVGDAEGRVTAERFRELRARLPAREKLEAAAALVAAVARAQRLSAGGVRGATVGLAAPLDIEGQPVGRRFTGFDLAASTGLSGLTDRVSVMNDADLGALGEMAFGAGRDLRDFIFVKMSHGLGAGLVLGGRLYRGSGGLAGNIGHVRVREDGEVCLCGNRGCLETLVSARSLIAALQPAHPARRLGLEDLARLVNDRDPGAERLLNDAGRTVGRTLADIVNVLNPRAIVVGGSLGALGEPLLSGMRESVWRYSQPAAAAGLAVLPGRLGERAEVLGGIAVALGVTPADNRS